MEYVELAIGFAALMGILLLMGLLVGISEREDGKTRFIIQDGRVRSRTKVEQYERLVAEERERLARSEGNLADREAWYDALEALVMNEGQRFHQEVTRQRLEMRMGMFAMLRG